MSKINVCGYNEVVKKADELQKGGKNVYVLFCGSKDENGKSWCPDCVEAEPVVQKCLPNMPSSSVFLYCSVGNRDYWKNKDNEFRVNLKLTGVPTFLNWSNKKHKLVENQLFDESLINMMFED